MKEKYTKPEMKVEMFCLSQTIATDCSAAHDSPWGYPNHADAGACGWVDTDGTVFWLEGTACTEPTEQGASIEGVCYNTPDGVASIFCS